MVGLYMVAAKLKIGSGQNISANIIPESCLDVVPLRELVVVSTIHIRETPACVSNVLDPVRRSVVVCL